MTAVSRGYVKSKEVSEETLIELRKLDIKEFAVAMGEQLSKNGHSWMAFKNGGERTASVAITPRKGRWSDFTRDGVGGTDVLSYYAYRKFDDVEFHVAGRFMEVVRGACEVAGIAIKYKDGSKEDFNGMRRVRDAVIVEHHTDGKADDITLNGYYRELLNLLSVTDGHRKHLSEVRGMSQREIDVRAYKSVSDNRRNRYVLTKELIARCGADPEGIPGFILAKGNYGPYWTFVGRNGFLIPFRSIHNHICGFQLRVDEEDIIRSIGKLRLNLLDGKVEVFHSEEGTLLWTGTRKELPIQLQEGRVELRSGSKYIWVSTQKDEERGILKGAQIGFPTPAPYHTAVPSSVLRAWSPSDLLSDVMDTSTVWWGEGPLKGDIASEYTEQVHLQIGGIKSYESLLAPTIALNATEVIISFDADAQTKEDDVGKTVLNCVEMARRELPKHGIKPKIALWRVEQSKGLDDLLISGYKPIIYDL
jgi:hypothetical protein